MVEGFYWNEFFAWNSIIWRDYSEIEWKAMIFKLFEIVGGSEDEWDN